MGLDLFECYAPLRIIFGEKSISKIGSLTARNGHRVLLVTGKRHLKESGVFDLIMASFKKTQRIEFVEVFDKASCNPDVDMVNEAKDVIINKNLDVIVAVGGGSSMDLAKAAAISAKQNMPVEEIISSNRCAVMEALSVICVPTTSGSGSEVTKYAVINDNRQKLKLAISSESIYPKVTLIDPMLTYDMSREIIANTGFDALCHAIEAYTSKSSSPITDLYCQKAISLVGDNIFKAYEKDKEAMCNMSLSAMFAGMALNVGRASLPHAMEHPLSAYKPDLAHGLGLSIVMMPFLKRAYRFNQERFADIAHLLGTNINALSLEDAAERVISAVENIKERLNLKTKLSDLGFSENDIRDIVENKFWTMEHGVQNSPCNFTKNDILNMYLEEI